MGWIEAEEEEQEARRRKTVSTSRSTLAVPHAMAAARVGAWETRGQVTPVIAAAVIGEGEETFVGNCRDAGGKDTQS